MYIPQQVSGKVLCRKRRNKLNRYTDGQVHLCKSTAVETFTGRYQRVIGMKV